MTVADNLAGRADQSFDFAGGELGADPQARLGGNAVRGTRWLSGAGALGDVDDRGHSVGDLGVAQVLWGSEARDAAVVAGAGFAASDSGDLAGYQAEVVRLAERHVSPSGRSDVELQELYNDMQRLVYDQLGKPVGDRVQALGLELCQEQTRRSVDGGWPPGYGGGASCPRWRRPGRAGAWLEASIGLGYRTWPSQRLDDPVLTLMLAIMTDQQQHTLLTRFVPVAPDDAELGAKIQRILADVDPVLATAAALLADERNSPS